MKQLTCIVCPNGCRLTIDGVCVSGNLCKKGEAFAIQEVTDPKRSVTTTCRTAFEDIPVAPVKTDGQIKKELMRQVVEEVNKITIREPMKMGAVVIENVLETGIDIILCTDRLEGRKDG